MLFPHMSRVGNAVIVQLFTSLLEAGRIPRDHRFCYTQVAFPPSSPP